MKYLILTHITAAILFSLVMVLIYATAQQPYRSEAYEPQDTSFKMEHSRTCCYYLMEGTDTQQNIGTFIRFYNSNGKLIYSGGTISSKAPNVPKGVLDTAKQHYTNNIAPQPTAQVHLAAVAAYTGKQDTSYVVVARSLHEVENCESNLIKTVVIFWAMGISTIALHWLIQNKTPTSNNLL